MTGCRIQINKLSKLLILSGFLCLFPVSVSFGNPQGANVAAGTAVVSSPASNIVQVNQTTDKAIINWQQFNIAPNEATRFNQPSASSITLNRINPTNGVSNILGKLTANGQVWLINPAGILFGASARVNVGSLLATTANITDQDFLSGNYHFNQSPSWNGAVINEGEITIADKGFAALVAPGVENSGTIRAHLGTVALAAGNEYTLDFYGDQLIQFGLNATVTTPATDQNGNPLTNGVKNSGKIIANGGRVLLSADTAEGVVNHAINMDGFVEANSAREQNGTIILMGGDANDVVVTGKMVATGKKHGQTGGTIKVLGNDIALDKSAVLDVSGDAGGGQINIGGDAHGVGSDPNAQQVYVGNLVNIYANALKTGNGGNIVIWSDYGTQFLGSAYAQGGALSGNGGNIEVSGGNLGYAGYANTLAANGSAGNLLLDPKNICIDASAANCPSSYGAWTTQGTLINPWAYATNATTSFAIIPALIATSASNVIFSANNDIILDAGNSIIMVNNGVGLTFNAGRSILINSPITTKTTGGITLSANNSAATSADRSTGTGDIIMAAGSSLTSPTGSISLIIGATTGAFTSGSITLYDLTSGNNMVIGSPNAVNINGALTTTTNGTVTITGNTSAGANNVTFGQAGSINTAAANKLVSIIVNTNGAGNATAGNIILNNVPSAINAGSGGITLRTDGGGTTNNSGGAITEAAGAIGAVLTTSGTITLGSPINSAIGGIGTAANPITTATITTLSLVDVGVLGAFVNNTNSMTLAAASVNANAPITVTSTGTLTLPNFAFSTGTGSIDFESNGGTLTTANTLTTTSGNIKLVASGLLSITKNLTTGTGTTSGITLTGSGVTFATNTIANAGYGTAAPGNITVNAGTAGLTLVSGDVLSAGNAAGTAGIIDIVGDAISLSGATSPLIGGTNTPAGYAKSVIFEPYTLTTTIGVNGGAGALALTSAILGNQGVTAGMVRSTNLRIGSNSGSGAITVAAWTPVANIAHSGMLTLDTGNTITQTGAINLATDLSTLLLRNASSVTLNTNNVFSTIAATNIAGALAITNASAAALTVGSATDDLGTVNGINTSGTVNLTTSGAGGLLTLNQGISTSGNVTLSSIGITQAAASTVNAGASTISVNAGAGAMNFAGSLTTTNATASAISLLNGTTAVLGNLTALSGTVTIGSGNITGAVTQTAGTAINALNLIVNTTNAVTLTQANNNISGTATLTNTGAANSFSLTTASALQLGTSTVGQNLAIITNGALTQTGTLTVPGVASFSVGANPITLTQNNNFTGAVTLNNTGANNVSIVDNGALILGGTGSSIGGALTATGTSGMTQTGTLTVQGLASFILSSYGNVTLNTAANVFNTGVSVSGGINSIAIRNATTNTNTSLSVPSSSFNSLTLQYDNVGFTLPAINIYGALSATAGGTIAQSGILSVNGAAAFTLTNPNSDILLDGYANNFGAIPTFTSNGNIRTLNLRVTNYLGLPTLPTGLTNLSLIYDVAPVALPALTLPGTLNVSSGVGITQTGILSVTGASTFGVTAVNSDILLNTSANNFATTPIIVNNTNLRDFALRNVATTAVVPTLPTTVRNVTLQFDNAGINFPALTITGNLIATANGLITQSGALSIGGTSTFAAGAANNISLTNAGNSMGTIGITNANNVTLNDNVALIFAASSMSGNLTATVNGSITQIGGSTLSVNSGNGVATFNVGSANNITLPTAGNAFGTLAVTAANAVSVIVSNPLILATSTVTGTYSVSAGGSISQSGVLNIASTPTFTVTAANSDILLASFDNDFSVTPVFSLNGDIRNIALWNSAVGTGTPALPVSFGSLTLIYDNSGIVLPNMTLSGSLIANANGAVTQSGAVSVAGTSNVSAGANSITLTNANNVFTGFVTLNNSGANDVSLTDNTALKLSASTIGRNLTLIAAGAITQNGALVVPGLSSFTAGNNAITLTTAGNVLTGAISFFNSGASNVALTNTIATVLGTSTIGSGTLTLVSNGGLSETGVLTQTAGAGVITLSDTAANSDILLGTQANILTGAITIGGTVGNIRDLSLRNLNTTASLPTNIGLLTGLRNLTVIFDKASIVLPALTLHTVAGVAGNLSIDTSGSLSSNAGGTITQSGALIVPGTSSFAAGANAITLTNSANQLTGAVTFSTSGSNNNATILNTKSLVFGTTNVSGNLIATTTTAGNTITQNSGTTITAAGLALSANAGAITLNQNNSVGTLAAQITGAAAGNTFNFKDTTALAIGTVGSLSGVNAPGGVTIYDSNAGITLNSSVNATVAGNSIVIAAQTFTNNAGSSALNAGSGNFLVWSGDPSNDIRGGLTYNFKQYNATYGSSTVLGTGNGFLYTLAPILTPSLTGTVSKVYNGTTVATLTSGNFNASGMVDGDTVSLNTGNAGVYATKNVGSNLGVSASGITIASANNGSATVYGYQLGTTTASGNVGVITPASITIGSNAGQTVVYGNSDPASAKTAYSVTGGTLYSTDVLSGNMGRAVGEAVGLYNFTQNTVSINDGNSGNNYSITFNGTTNKFQITQSALTASIANQTKVYGANDPALSGIAVTLGGLVNASVTDINGNVTAINDTSNVSSTLASLTRTAGETVGSGPYSINAATFNVLAGSAASNYISPTGLTGSPILTITKASLTGSIANQTKVYGANDPALSGISVTLAGIINNASITTWNGTASVNDTGLVATTLASLTRTAGENVSGSPYGISAATFNALTGTAAGNYNIPTLTGSPTLSITKASLTGAIANQTKTYGANDPTLSGISVTLGGVINNSAIATWNGNVSVNDTTLVSATPVSLTRAVGEIVSGSPYAITAGTFTLSGTSAGNYNSPTFAGSPTLTITKASLTGSIANQTKVYGANDPTLSGIGVTLAGIINNPSITTWNGTASVNDTGNVGASLASLTRTVGEVVSGSPYAISAATFNALTGSAAGNYNIPTLTGSPTLTITKASLTGSIANQTKVYGANDPTLSGIGVTLTGIINNANITTWNGTVGINNTGNVAVSLASLTRTAGELVSGSPYAISAATFNALTGSAAGNYSVPTFTGSPTLTITKASLTGSIANQTKVYGANDPSLSGIGVTLAGIINNASITTWSGTASINDTGNVGTTLASLTRAAGENVSGSPYAINAATFNALAGSAAGNYNIPTFTGSPTLTITKASLTGTIANQTKVYGANDPTLSGIGVTLGGVINNPAIVTWNGNVSVNDTALVSATPSSLTRAVGEIVSGSPYAITAGTFTLSGTSAGNYNSPAFNGSPTLTITKASLTGSIANQTKVYGANDPTLSGIGVTLTGIINNANISSWNGTVSVNDSGNVATSLASLTRTAGELVSGGPYAISAATFNALTGGAAGNYNIPTFTGSPTLTITKASLIGSIANQTKVYGANDPSLSGIGVTLAGIINNANISTWNGTVSVNDSGNVATTLASLARTAGENVSGSPYAISAAT
ncbi:MAG: filamentous hemagglutinin N-terminal domain-containing protein, partial [Gammaproteobacteria bacterium]|nr:filamentous hemagglutinin N-terminal domain-containing protein [Gammaproteobacteria bacterium]